MRCERDELLGAALRELETPEHRPEFHAELRRRLAAERVAPLVDVRRRRPRARWAVRVAALAAVGALAFVALDLVRSDDAPGPRIVGVATAAEIKTKVRTALASIDALSGIVAYDGPFPDDETRWRFVVTARGDLRLSGLTATEEIAYDADRGVERQYRRDEQGVVSAGIFRGLAPGRPDPTSSGWILEEQFGALVRAFLAAGDPHVREVTYDGRPAWELEVSAVPSAIVPELSGDAFTITVDRGTGLPVEVRETFKGAFRSQTRIEELVLDPEIEAGTFGLDFPPEARPNVIEHGFRRVELDRVADVVGYPPLVPGWLPAGYELAEVAVAGDTGYSSGVEGSNPTSIDVVSLGYRRGFDEVVVTMRRRHVPGWPDAWSDPLATGEGYVDEPQPVRIGRGALSGVEADVLIVPRNLPHLWALTDALVVTVAGDLGRAELLRVAESLAERQ
jgi:hypothetical protein